MAGIVIGSFLGILIIVLLIVLIFFLVRRRKGEFVCVYDHKPCVCPLLKNLLYIL